MILKVLFTLLILILGLIKIRNTLLKKNKPRITKDINNWMALSNAERNIEDQNYKRNTALKKRKLVSEIRNEYKNLIKNKNKR